MKSVEQIVTAASASPHNGRFFLIMFLGVLAAIGPFIMDFYLPALPDVVDFFGTSASTVQLSLTSCMAGLAIGQLIIGPLSDCYGRRLPLRICIGLFTLSCIGILFAQSISELVMLRLLQGLSSAGGVVIARAAAADIYEGEALTRFFALLMTVNGIAPVLAPVAGSFVLTFTDWRGIFACQALMGGILLLSSLFLKESLSRDKRSREPGTGFRNYAVIFRNPPFMLLTGVMTALTAGLFAYISASPFIFQVHYNTTAFEYSLLFAVNAASFAAGAQVSGKLSPMKAARTGVVGAFISGMALFMLLLSEPALWSAEAGFIVYLFFYGLSAQVISGLAIGMERKHAGAAAAMVGFFPFFICGVVSPLAGIGNTMTMTGLIIAVSSVIAVLLWQMACRQIR